MNAPQTTEQDPGFNSIPLLNVSDEGKVPKNRLTKASALRNIHARHRDDDLTSAANRADTQDLLDGGQPYPQAELEAAGMGDMTNINWDGAAETLENAMNPYYSLSCNEDTMISVSTLHGDEATRADWNAILAEEIWATIYNWEGFSFHVGRLAHKTVWDGVGFGHWADDIDWRFRASGLGQFFLPRQTFASESELECATVLEEFTVTRLYNFIRDAEESVHNGWDVSAVKRALAKASSAEPPYKDWERLADEIRNNDLSVVATTPVVRCIVGFVKEFDGTVSQYVTTETACGDTEEFLYIGRSAYAKMRDAFVMFMHDLGTNTKTHGCRGLGKKIFPFEHQRNRSLCRMMDQSTLASSLMLQAPDEESLANAGLQFYGNTAVIDPNCKVVQYAAPDLQRTVVPAIEIMERMRDKRTQRYQSGEVFGGDQRKTKYEVQAELQQESGLTDVQLGMWLRPFQRLIRGTVRRMSRRTYLPLDPGGEEIADLHLRLVRRGVPLEALFRLDHARTRLIEPIGLGSASSRTIALSRMEELVPVMDDVGKREFYRAKAIDAVGVANANRFFPPGGTTRTTLDTSIAILQNSQLLMGIEVPVLPSDFHLAHAREHIKPLIDGFTAVEQGQMPIEQMAQQHQLLFNHCAEHVQGVSGDPSSEAEAAMLRQMLQQVGEVISNGLRKAQATAAKQQEEGGQPEEGQQPGPDPKQIAEFERHKAQMDMAREKFQLEQDLMLQKADTEARIKERDAAVRRAIADADGAARIARESRARQTKPRKTKPE